MTSLISALTHVFLPLSIVIGVTSVFGLLGNGVAFYIFSFRFPTTGFNILMASLAAFDFVACLVHMPLDIATFFQIGSVRVYLCKITCFQLAFTATGSAAVLVAIAVVRYCGIRKPLVGVLTPRLAAYVILGSTLFAIGISLPITFLFGAGELQTDNNITAEICAVEPKYMDTLGPLTYYVILASLYIFTFVLHSCLYAQSVLIVWNRRRVFVSMRGRNNVVMLSPATRRSNPLPPIPPPLPATPPPSRSSQLAKKAINRNRMTSASSQVPLCPRRGTFQGDPSLPTTSGLTSASIPEIDINASIPENEYYGLDDDVSDDATTITTDVPTPSSDRRTQSTPLPTPPRDRQGQEVRTELLDLTDTSSTSSSPSPLSHDRRNARYHQTATSRPARKGQATNKGRGGGTSVNQTSYRVLFVVMAISLTYFLSYAPHFGVMFYLFTHDVTVFRASAQNLAFELLMRSFFINNVLDPVIYGLLSRDFRREVGHIMATVCKVC